MYGGGAAVVVDMMGAGTGLGGEVAAVLVTLQRVFGCERIFSFFCGQHTQLLTRISHPKQCIVSL